MVKIQMKIGITFIKYKIYGKIDTFIKYKIYGKDSNKNWNHFYKV